jgi:rubredoxin
VNETDRLTCPVCGDKFWREYDKQILCRGCELNQIQGEQIPARNTILNVIGNLIEDGWQLTVEKNGVQFVLKCNTNAFELKG